MIGLKKSFKCVLFALAMVCVLAVPSAVAKAGTNDYTITTYSVNGTEQTGTTIDLKNFVSAAMLTEIEDAANTADYVEIVTEDSQAQTVGTPVFVSKTDTKWDYTFPTTADTYTLKFYASADGETDDTTNPFTGDVSLLIAVQNDNYTVTCGAVTANTDVDLTALKQTVSLQVDGVTATAGVDTVKFDIYSGSTKVLTVEGTADGTSYKATVNAKSLTPKYGKFTAKAVITDANGETAESDSTAFTVTGAKGTFTITKSTSTATFTLTTGKIYAADKVASVKVKVWKDGEKVDPTFYTAKSNGDGTYTYTISTSKYNYKSGTYYFRPYVKFKDGKTVYFADAKSASITPSNFIVYGTTSKSFEKKFYIYNPTATSKVTAKLWSKAGNGSDKKSYSAVYESANNRLVITAKMNALKYSGTAYLQLFDKSGTSIKKYTFTVKKSEVVKTGWYYEKKSDGRTYKLYYKDGKVVTNLTNVLKLQKCGKLRAEVNRQKCRVTIYAYDKETKSWCIPVICFKCSPGKASTPTPKGTFKTSNKYRWHELMGPSYGQYCTRITGGVLFHSVAGSNTTSYNLSAGSYNRLGNPASHGCVRLCVRDAKWIYDYCAAGMQVKIFDSSYEGPLTCQYVPTMSYGQRYDPTDPNAPKNKYNQ